MKTVIEMARMAGVRDDGHRFEFDMFSLERFAELVRADEREACERVAGIALLGSEKALSDRVLKAIRARGQA